MKTEEENTRNIFKMLDWIFILFLFNVCIFIGKHLGRKEMKTEMQKDAIEHNIAEYVIVDKETGETEFKWRKLK